MGVVKYTDGFFNVGETFTAAFALEWAGEESLIGLRLKDRKKPDYKVEIVKTDWSMGIFRVFYKEGGTIWQCFDHCVAQFELDA